MNQDAANKVLIIEDERTDREIYKRYLQLSTSSRFEFAESATAAGGTELCGKWRPDCILLDFNLPDLDGLGVLLKLRDESGRLPCAVVMLTAFGDEELAVNAMKNGAMDYLPKWQVAPDILPLTVANAIARFQMQRRIAQQRSELETSARRYQSLLEAIPHIVWMTDAEGRVEYANCKWQEYTGLGIDQAGPLGWDDALHPEDLEPTRSAWKLASVTGTVFEIEHRLKMASDSSYRWHLGRAIPIRDATGEVTNWFGTDTEIENQKEAETVNMQREKLQGIGRLAAGVAHDFNNLLVVILGGTSYAMETLPASHQAQEMLRGVVQAAERAAELTAKMLAYAGKGNVWIELTDLNRLVRDACDSLRDSIPENIQLDIQPEPNLPSVTTDSRQMRQAISDLVMNAAEAIRNGAAGNISVSTRMLEIAEGTGAGIAMGQYAELEVRDTGCGMSEDIQQKIFDPFFSTKFTGRGLGLAAVHGFVRSNGGHVQVESSPGNGTCFRILLPAVPVEARSRVTST